MIVTRQILKGYLRSKESEKLSPLTKLFEHHLILNMYPFVHREEDSLSITCFTPVFALPQEGLESEALSIQMNHWQSPASLSALTLI